MKKPVVLIGYSGHAFVVAEVLASAGHLVQAYCDREKKLLNPFNLAYLGDPEQEQVQQQIRYSDYFVAVGDNAIRRRLSDLLQRQLTAPLTAAHASAVISPKAAVGAGVLVAPKVVINALAEVGDGVICNTGAVIEHECKIGAFAHIAPHATLTGGVRVGAGALVGAGAVVKPGITIGENAVIGAGAVVLKDVKAGAVVAGNPARLI
ncbi:MAG: NeuD/PglB/VioB family sugar acetyltransferase [Hymenobacteraceae bacterium]|nr:NeuD/PglB/VioB family sugar acetyltransferase [Hymenobacteraceae bacterium]MDX5394777.1 NeuD/PglB/VioB family sugar acetyltransferase [Hymenobacteraceae bacterium]MDX5510808.1 NeuD/PglB/VioB family sugar acetyltransferase [Hymenobacteraceae bacterium]